MNLDLFDPLGQTLADMGRDYDGRPLLDPRLQLGTEPHKLVRRADPDTSHAAAKAVDTTNLEGMVLEVIRASRNAGCISDEVRDRCPGKAYSSVTARFKALKDKGYIVDSGRRRPGSTGKDQAVLVASEFV